MTTRRASNPRRRHALGSQADARRVRRAVGQDRPFPEAITFHFHASTALRRPGVTGDVCRRHAPRHEGRLRADASRSARARHDFDFVTAFRLRNHLGRRRSGGVTELREFAKETAVELAGLRPASISPKEGNRAGRAVWRCRIRKNVIVMHTKDVFVILRSAGRCSLPPLQLRHGHARQRDPDGGRAYPDVPLDRDRGGNHRAPQRQGRRRLASNVIDEGAVAIGRRCPSHHSSAGADTGNAMRSLPTKSLPAMSIGRRAPSPFAEHGPHPLGVEGAHALVVGK